MQLLKGKGKLEAAGGYKTVQYGTVAKRSRHVTAIKEKKAQTTRRPLSGATTVPDEQERQLVWLAGKHVLDARCLVTPGNTSSPVIEYTKVLLK